MNIYDVKYDDQNNALLAVKKIIENKDESLDDAKNMAEQMMQLHFRDKYAVEVVLDPNDNIKGIFPIDEEIIESDKEAQEVIKRALLVEGSRIIVYHNFPVDEEVSQKIEQAGTIFGISGTIDHSLEKNN